MLADTRKLSIEFVNPSIVRVRFVPQGEFKENGTNVCIRRETQPVNYKIEYKSEWISLKSSALKLQISKKSGSVRYFDTNGNLLLEENSDNPRSAEPVKLSKATFNDYGSTTQKTANGDMVTANIAGREAVGTAWRAKQQFVWKNGEALYGLGSHQEDYMNLRGTQQYLYQHNLKKSMPVLMSTLGYGLLFDAGSAMVFHDDTLGSSIEMLAVNQIDYYFMFGPEPDKVVRQFRTLTGKVELPPKYAFGYVQSKERYTGPSDIDSVVQRFRANKIPLDVIVQDWQYWTGNLWGHKKFDEVKFPEPEKMIARVHQQNARFMLSIWPQVAANEEIEMAAKGYVLGRRIYDAYNPAARQMYWDDYVGKNLFSKGVDAWWCDSSEPVDFDWNRGANNIASNPAARFEKNVKELSDLAGELRANTYALHHAMGIYENQRKTGSEKRLLNLTRASYPGMQRYGTMVWNGDTKATWADFKSWIPSGLNYVATGSPYWTIDVGAFFVKNNVEWFWKGDFPKGPADAGYREFYVRNLQYAGWLPLFRSHGTDFAREPWQFGNPGDPFYEAIIRQINLRYRLLPYIYSVANMVSDQDFTMTRPLFFDFRKDARVYDIKDQFMFGSEFLVCPVTDPMFFSPGNVPLNTISKSRQVYLPAGVSWIDFWTGEKFLGGQTITSEAAIDHIPVFVKAGSVVPMGPIMQHSGEQPNAAWEIRIYPGANGKFTVYEDEGSNYNYQKGESSAYEITWNDKKQEVTIGRRKGSFPGMVGNRTLKIVLVKPGTGIDINETTGKKIEYNGDEKILSMR